MISMQTTPTDGAKIKVCGVGGGGGNAINSMISLGLSGVDFIAANTDKQALEHNLAQTTIQIGQELTNGLGAGADPSIGRDAVEESIEELKEILSGSDMLFVTAGMGGGTGTGGAPVIARVGQEMGSLVVAIVTRPFLWEGRKRQLVAEEGIKALREYVDALIVIPNQKLLDIIDKNTSFGEAFQKVDEVLYNATRGISDIINHHGMVNVDFADVRTIMKGMGDALMGIGTSSGEHRAIEATEEALNSPLLDGISISGAKGVLVNISGGSDLAMHEVNDAVSIVGKAAGDDVNLIHGVVINDDPSEEFMVTVVATGFSRNGSGSEKEEEEEEEPQLPFNEPQKKKAFIPNRVPFPNTGNTILGKMADKPSFKSSDSEVESPKGPEELKDYDEPAYARRSERKENENEKNHVHSLQAVESDGPPSIDYNEYEQPAFLRRIMD